MARAPQADSSVLTLARLFRVLENTRDVGLTISQYRVLALLSGGDERASRLAAKLAVTKPTVTSVIDSLVERGYVTRVASPDDRRAVTISITPQGRAAATASGAAFRATFDEVLRHCADADAVLAAIDQIGGALDARWDAAARRAEGVAASGAA
jgi:DNA-binding MarR family transcriptional regulator